MNDLDFVFEKIGLSSKERSVYLSLLKQGPTAIRKLASDSGVNRGSVYEALKTLEGEGLVSYFHKGKRQHFVAENPATLLKTLSRKKKEIEDAETTLETLIPKLSSLSPLKTQGPVVKFYENYSGVRSILEDVLDSLKQSKTKEYVAFSSATLRPYLYHKEAYPNFTDERIKQKVFVRTIASGEGGGTQGKDARKWLTRDHASPTYKLIYAGKVAMISVGAKNIPHGFIVEDQALFETEFEIFNSLWELL